MPESQKVIYLSGQSMPETEKPSTGFAPIWRTIVESPFYSHPVRRSVFMHFILTATHKPYETTLCGRKITLTAGQLISGRQKISQQLGYSEKEVENAIDYFKREGMVTATGTKQGSIFTLVNWLKFNQLLGQPNGQLDTSSDAASSKVVGNPLGTIQEVNLRTRSKDLVCEVGQDPVEVVIEHLNLTAGRKYHKTKDAIRFIGARLREGYTIDQLKAVVDYKCSEWKNDPKFKKFLRPQTLFNASKFPMYLEESESISDCPHEEILNLWNAKLKNLPPVNPSDWDRSLNSFNNLEHLWDNYKARGKYSDITSGLIWWNKIFSEIKKRDRLMNANWFNLDWFLKPENFVATLRGNYDGGSSNA